MRRVGEFRPGERQPRGAREGGGQGAAALLAPGPDQGFEWATRSGRRLRLAGLAGAVRGWDPGVEVPTRKLRREVERFGKGKTEPYPPPPARVFH